MHRHSVPQRPQWQHDCDHIGFPFHSMGGRYWQEGQCYAFSAAEIDTLETASQTLHDLALEACAEIVRRDWLARMGWPSQMADLIVASWQRRDPHLYGRFDLAYDGVHPPKLLEYNADTPTALIEASLAQWYWLEAVRPQQDQFNAIHEHLVQHWRQWAGQSVTFMCDHDSEEDFCTVEYLRDTALQAGVDGRFLWLDDLGWLPERGFVDLDLQATPTLFKLYPWEWLLEEPFARHLPHAATRWLEPPWKLLLSSKALLPLLWELFPEHPNLLPAAFSPLTGPSVRKPFHAREGANIDLQHPEHAERSDGPYHDQPCIWQRYQPLPCFDGWYPVIGSWIIGNQAAGIGLREDRTRITRNSSCFVPHYFSPIR